LLNKNKNIFFYKEFKIFLIFYLKVYKNNGNKINGNNMIIRKSEYKNNKIERID